MKTDVPELLQGGSLEALQLGRERLSEIPVDLELTAPEGYAPPEFACTVERAEEISGPATYQKGAKRTVRFRPTERPGWSFDRADLPEQLPIPAVVGSVCQASRAIVLRSGIDANRLRMSEHVICHRLGLGIDCLEVSLDSEDPPLFDRGSLPLMEALDRAGRREIPELRLKYLSPEKPQALLHPNNGGFLLWEPPEDPADHRLFLDVAIGFPTAIGKERLKLCLTPETFRPGCAARTNCAASEVRKARLLKWFVPALRNLGYTRENILLADRDHYLNEPEASLTLPSGKALEAVWHRTCLDLVAALSLLPPLCRPAGTITSFKAGHLLDVRFLTLLLAQDRLRALPHG